MERVENALKKLCVTAYLYDLRLLKTTTSYEQQVKKRIPTPFFVGTSCGLMQPHKDNLIKIIGQTISISHHLKNFMMITKIDWE